MTGAYSTAITPKRSLTAGGGLATTEMRLALISIVDRALHVAPQAQPTLYVDDLSIEVVGGDRFVMRQLVAFTVAFCQAITDALMVISHLKSYCTASTTQLGHDIQAALAEYGIQYKSRVTSLGAAMGAAAAIINSSLSSDYPFMLAAANLKA